MNQMVLLQNISKYLARFSEQIKILNSNHEFSINTHAENILINILNIVYDLNLKNLNHSESGNYSAIDLLDDTSQEKISFQITSTYKIKKVKDCLSTFFRNGIYEKASVLNIFILTSKQEEYSNEVIQKQISKEIDTLVKKNKIKDKYAINFQFNSENNIFDKRDLYNKLNSDNDLDKIQHLEGYLRKQFDILDEKENLSNYYQRIKNMFYDVVMDDEKGMTLDQIYTQPSFSVINTAFKKDDVRFKKKSSEKFYAADERYKIHEFIDDVFKNKNFLELKKLHRLILILGYPGQGKSSFCKKMMHDYIFQEKTNEKPLFYFQLRNIRQVREFIYNPITILHDEALSNTEQTLDRNQFAKSFLILDGLDELYMRDNLKLEDIDKLCVELVRSIERYPELQIIVTSRYGYIDDEKLTKEDILIVQLASFSLELQTEWVRKYIQFHPETWLSENTLRIFNSEDRFSHISELLVQPLLLHMVASVKIAIDENTNRAKIYQQLFTELIDRKYAREGQLEILKNIEKDDLRSLIREVAFSIFQTGNEYITKTELLKLSATQSFLKLLPEVNFRDSIKGVMISFYFKEIEKNQQVEVDDDKSNYAIEFLHKSLREYMTAEKIYYKIVAVFLEKKMNSKYVLDDSKMALLVINEIFGAQDLSEEIKIHLRGIIKNSHDIDHNELCDRLCLFLEDFFKSDFIVEYRMEYDRNCIDTCIRCFHGLWYFISSLRPQKNYLKSLFIKDRFLKYLSFVNSTMGDLEDFDFSYQDFSQCYFRNVDFDGCLFFETNFSQCEIENVTFGRSRFYRTSFARSFIHSCNFSDTLVRDSNFRKCYIDKFTIISSQMEDVDFSDSEIDELDLNEYGRTYSTGLKMERCKFENTRIDSRALKQLTKWYPQINHEAFIEIMPASKMHYQPRKETRKVSDSIIPENYKRIILTDEAILKENPFLL